ncbi:MAG: Uma2 family endonuclease [Cyanobacteria bacterium P01_A01_bin.114]
MTVAANKLTFEEYLAYTDGTDIRYELVDGELIAMGIGSGLHGAILKLLEKVFDAEIARLGAELVALQAAVGVRSPRRGRWDTSRIPDVSVITLSQWRELQNREAIIELNEPPPHLVVEVVSDSTRRTDYRAKRAEYMVLGISEFWIVDPDEAKITVLVLVDDWYEATEYAGNSLVQSALFPDLTLTAAEILTGGLD